MPRPEGRPSPAEGRARAGRAARAVGLKHASRGADTVTVAPTVAALLLERSAATATGCLVLRCSPAAVDDGGQDSVEVYLRRGLVYAVGSQRRDEVLTDRLVAARVVPAEAVTEARAVRERELRGWDLAELLVHLGHADAGDLEDHVVEMLLEAVTGLLGRTVHAWRFREGRRTRLGTVRPLAVPELLAVAARRRRDWAALRARVGGPDAVPSLAPDPPDDVDLPEDGWRLLCQVDGRRDLAALAARCGLGVLPAATLLGRLHESGFVTVPPPPPVPDAEGSGSELDWLRPDAEREALSRRRSEERRRRQAADEVAALLTQRSEEDARRRRAARAAGGA